MDQLFVAFLYIIILIAFAGWMLYLGSFDPEGEEQEK